MIALETRKTLTDKTIFVVEDDGIIALCNYELLTKSGYAVPRIFMSGEELLDHLGREELPDLILMDIGLAGKMDGIETARMVREHYDIPVVFLSSYNDDQLKAMAAAVSPFGYIVKPACRMAACRDCRSCARPSFAVGNVIWLPSREITRRTHYPCNYREHLMIAP